MCERFHSLHPSLSSGARLERPRSMPRSASPIGLVPAACAALLFAFAASLSACASKAALIRDYVNPLDVPIADPQILHDGDLYYLYGTTAADTGLEVFTSPDLVHWRRHGFCHRKSAESWGQDCFWAPEVIRRGDTFYLFYTAYNPKANVRNICVATSSSPLGPFLDAAAPILPVARGFIDAHPFRDPDTGEYYLFVMEENVRPPVIWVGRLAENLLCLDGPLQQCLTASQEWENNWVEGPFVIKRGPWYYMLYSGFGYASPDYSVGYATAWTPFGPWIKYPHNPILRRSGAVSGPGHNSVVASPDGSELFTAYHRHLTFAGDWQRELALDRIQFLENGPEPAILAVDGPTHSPRPLPSGAKRRLRAASDEFNASDLDRARWLSFGEDADHWRLEDGRLCIDTQDGDIWTRRLDAKNLFLQYAPEGDFAVETRIEIEPQADHEQAFLLVWQDQGNFLKLATVFSSGLKFEVGREITGRYESLLQPNAKGRPVRLRIQKTGNHYTFHARGEGDAAWESLGPGLDAEFQQVQIGLGAIAPGSGAARTARFDYFRVEH